MGSINTGAIETEIIRFVKSGAGNDILQASIMSKGIQLNKYAKTLTKVRGEVYNVQALMGNVVQSFNNKWREYGDIQFRKKAMNNYHQKVNFGLDPTEILGSWYQAMYDEGKDLKTKTVSKFTIHMLGKKIISDVNHLSVHGVYDPADVSADVPTFGKSMNGINKIHTALLANSENPAFKIPIDAITDNNIVDVVTEMDKALPELLKPLIKGYKMSIKNKENYLIEYRDTYGQNTDYNRGQGARSYLGNRELIGVAGMSDNIITATIDGNFFKIVDLIDNPAAITDVQKQDYKLKIFGEFTLGYDYGVNELVIVGDPTAAQRGLGDAALNKLFYPNEF